MKIRIEAVHANNVTRSWKIVLLNGSNSHNHPASHDPSFHPGHRRRDMECLTSSDLSHTDLVAAQTAAGVSPQVAVASIRSADPCTAIIAKDVANKKNAGRREALDDDTPTELLLKKLEEHNFFFKIDVDQATSRLRALFWSHPGIKEFYAWNSDIMVMDCTYKTNNSDLPLLNIIAMTNMNTVLPIAQCFFTRNVLAKTRTVLSQVENPNSAPGQDKYENTVETSESMTLFYNAADSSDEEEFVKCCAEILSCNSELADYLDLHWWKYKIKVVRCWTSQYLHFGYRATSPAKGTHSKCKKWLVASKGNLLTVFEKLLPWWQTCIKNTSLDIERDVGKFSHILQDERYSAVVMFVSRYALNETANLWKQAVEIVTKKTLIKTL